MTNSPTQPRAGIGAVVFHNEQVLLVKRARPPCQGQWAIPGGKIKPGESLQQAAEREILEETGITIKAGEPVFAFELIERDQQGQLLYHYVIIDLAAEYIQGEINASSDASDAGWFSKSSLDSVNLNQTTRELLQRFEVFRHQH
jgi:ADP-ribose pyrophosphatase